MTATDDLPLERALRWGNFDTSCMYVAQELGFGGIAENSLDAVSNRDFVLDSVRRRHVRDPPLATRQRDRALVEPGVGFRELSDSFSSGPA